MSSALPRRAFLRTASGCAAGVFSGAFKNLTGSETLGASGKPGANNRLVVAHIGVGGMGMTHLGNMLNPVDDKPLPDAPPPEGLDWDLWLGPLPWRPFNRRYHPANFRWVMESGGGQIRDRGVH